MGTPLSTATTPNSSSSAAMIDCEVCRASIVSSREKALKCSGPCGKEFHAFCADLNLSYWKAWSAGVGLLWFCAKCREDLGSQQGHRRDDVKKAAVEALELLPVEIWTEVFQSLGGYQLRQVRLTCRSWNRIVGRSSLLMNKVVLRLPKDIVLEQNCEEVELLSAWKSRYSHIVLDQIRIVQVDSWWPAIAENLESLTITKCQITITTLLTMLEAIHNLKSLTLTCGLFFDANGCPAQTTFKLPSLEQLILNEVIHGDLLDVFRQLCPRLKVFKLPTGTCAEIHPQKVVRIIEAVKNTLEFVELPMVLRMWQSINAINGLRLRGISLKGCQEQLAMAESHIIELSRKHPSAEVLLLPPKLFLYETTLKAVAENLPNLQYLKIFQNTRGNSILFALLQQTSQLTRIDIAGNDNYYRLALDFASVQNNSLKYLNLSDQKISQGYATSFPNLTILNLNKCTFPSWSQIFDSKLKSLQRVTLQSVRVEKREECVACYFREMQYLSITDCSVSKALLIALFSLCPNLTELRLLKIDELDDAAVLALCRKLKNLRKITIKSCYKTTKLTEEYIGMHCRQIESICFDNAHVSAYRVREECCEEEYDYDDYSGGLEFVYDYSL